MNCQESYIKSGTEIETDPPKICFYTVDFKEWAFTLRFSKRVEQK